MVFIFALLTFVVSESHAQNLQESPSYNFEQLFRLAIQRGYDVQVTIQDIERAQAQANQAQAGNLPKISANGNFMTQETPSSSIGQTLFPSNQTSAYISIKQNLFSGLKDLATIRSRNESVKASEAAKEKAIFELYKNVAQSFFMTLAYRSDVAGYKEQYETTLKRKNYLSRQQKSGIAREADVKAVEASLYAIEASLTSAKQELASYEEALRFLTGLSGDIALSNSISSSDPKDLNYWLSAIEERPDIREAKHLVSAAEFDIKSAKSGHLPTLDLGANYYLTRPGVYENVTWDTSVTLSIPIYTGGEVSGKVREKLASKTSSTIEHAKRRAAAEQTVRTLYRTLVANIEKEKQLAQAAQAYDRQYTLMTRDNQGGLTTNTEVLIALNSSQAAKRESARQKYNILYNFLQIMVESAQVSLKDYL